jgi:hypothetical protein
MSVVVRSIDSYEDLVKYSKEITKKVRESKESTKKLEEPRAEESELVKDLRKIMSEHDFGCQAAHVARTLEIVVKAVTGEVVRLRTRRNDSGTLRDYELYSLVVPLDSDGGHSYKIGKPFMIVNPSISSRNEDNLQFNEEEGNDHFGEWRYATDEEAESFFNSDYKDEIKEYLESNVLEIGADFPGA